MAPRAWLCEQSFRHRSGEPLVKLSCSEFEIMSGAVNSCVIFVPENGTEKHDEQSEAPLCGFTLSVVFFRANFRTHFFDIRFRAHLQWSQMRGVLVPPQRRAEQRPMTLDCGPCGVDPVARWWVLLVSARSFPVLTAQSECLP